MADYADNYDFSKVTPIDNTGLHSVFKSGYRNIRFALSPASTMTVTEADMSNLVGIAYRFYGDRSLWYMLLAYNGLQDPVQDVYPGLVLNMPSKSSVIAYLSAQQTTQTKALVI